MNSIMLPPKGGRNEKMDSEPKKRKGFLSPWAQELIEGIDEMDRDTKKVKKSMKTLKRFFEE